MIDYEMRRKERLADFQTAERILENAEYGVLSTAGSDGFPYGVPLNFAYDGKKMRILDRETLESRAKN